MATASNSSSRSEFSKRLLGMIVSAIFAALLIAVKEALAFLPNIELVSILIICFSVVFGRKVIPAIYIFAIVEGLLYSFNIWWMMYLYVWTILAVISMLLRRVRNPLIWALICGLFGMSFGLLCAIPYIFVFGWTYAFSWWISGLYFDLVHAVSNLATGFLFTPLVGAMSLAKRKMRL